MPKKINWAGNKEAKFPGVRKNYKDYHWQANEALTDEIPYILEVDIEKIEVYRTKETDINLVLDKATKVGPTVNGNIVLLDVDNLDGDIYDSGVQIEDFSITEFNGGVYDNDGEYDI